MMSIKVVHNTCHGGAALTPIALLRMVQRGSEWAMDVLSRSEDHFSKYGYELTKINRHDPILVSVVEELGSNAASAAMSKLEISIVKGNQYRIEEYDGWEKVVEPQDIEWIIVRQDG